MTNTTIPAESLGAPSAAASFYRWEVADKAIAIHLSLDLLDRLEREVLESFKAVTKRGSEIGGVLAGRVVPGVPKTVVIEQFEPVECDYSRGPLYLLSDDDKARLQQALARVKSSGNASVVGFFRSNTRRDIAMDEEDLALAAECFSDPNHVFLLVRPFAMKPSAGAFFIWEDGQIRSEESYLQFPFKRAELLKNFAQFIIGPAEAPAPREPLVMPRREERPAAPPPVALKREEPKPAAAVPPKREEPIPAPPPPAALKREEPKPAAAAPPKREEPPAPATLKREEPKPSAAPPPKREEPMPLTFKREERPAIIPVTARREEPAPPKRDERPPAPLNLKREERPPIAPVQPKREERPSGPTLVSKREEPAPPPVKREEKPAAPPVTVKREERPPITVKRDEKPAPVAAAPAKPQEKPVPAKQAEVTAPAKKEEQAPVVDPSPATAARSLAPAFAEEVEPAAPGLFSRLKWLIIVLVIAVLGAGGYFAFRALKQPAQEAAKPAETSLALKVERSAGQLLLSWNRNSALIATATRATLSITDGDHKEDVDLDLGQLRSGSIVYSPMTNDVSFRLEVTDLKNGKSLGESVRVLAGRPSPAVAAMQPAAAKPAPGTPEKPLSPVPQQSAASPAAAQPAPQQAPPAPEQPTVVAGPAVTAAPPKPESLAARLRAAESQELPAPPALEGASNSLAGSAPVASTPVAAPAAPAPQPATPVAAQQAPAQQAPVQQPSAPAAQPLQTGGRAQEARLVRRVSPMYPALARQTRVSGIVRVRATVGKDGKVKKAVPLSGPPLLRQAAAEAVKMWLYSPAMLNGEPVESETQVDVNFMM